MACYIASNDNRHYVAQETTFANAAAVTAENRIPSVKLGIRQVTQAPRRRDKTGTRTFPGLPSGLRQRTTWDLTAYLTSWPDPQVDPCYGPLVRAALGAPPDLFTGATVQGVTNETTIATVAAHGLEPFQAIRFGDEIRFVASVINTTSFVINAPFSTEPAPNEALGAAITYRPATALPGVSIYDYWSPADAVQRLLAGAAVDRMRIRINGDFHQLQFQGPAACLAEDIAFTPGTAGLTDFPLEPTVDAIPFSLVPGNLGQVWLGVDPARFHTLVQAEVVLDNDVDLRADEFGINKATCISAGIRNVSVDLDMIANNQTATKDLYSAARQRTPVSVMFQLGQQQQHLCGVYLPAVVPDVPEFDDGETRLQWRFRDSRAQGAGDDELIIAFA